MESFDGSAGEWSRRCGSVSGKRGAKLDLEGAAGVGRLDVVQSFFTKGGKLRGGATQEQMKSGFAWACEFGHTRVVEFVLDRGMTVDARLRHHNQTRCIGRRTAGTWNWSSCCSLAEPAWT
jgi:hypothetical protein